MYARIETVLVEAQLESSLKESETGKKDRGHRVKHGERGDLGKQRQYGQTTWVSPRCVRAHMCVRTPAISLSQGYHPISDRIPLTGSPLSASAARSA